MFCPLIYEKYTREFCSVWHFHFEHNSNMLLLHTWGFGGCYQIKLKLNRQKSCSFWGLQFNNKTLFQLIFSDLIEDFSFHKKAKQFLDSRIHADQQT